MSGLAVLAKESGHEVSGSDTNIYPPMSLQLEKFEIPIYDGYAPAHIPTDVDYVIVGNVIKRGNPAMEYILNRRIPFISGPQWLKEHILRKRDVIAIAGTHGKTTTTSMITWILTAAGFNPGFLIGGIPENFAVSAKLGQDPFFVIEADEYDCAFFDKRAKFMHYYPKVLVLNNLEFDHADIYPDLNAIMQQFIYLLRTVPNNGWIVQHMSDFNLQSLTDPQNGYCFSQRDTFHGEGALWQAIPNTKDCSAFTVIHENKTLGEINWPLLGEHNMHNALAAIAASSHVGVDPVLAIEALPSFKNVKRRLETKACVRDVVIYDDFAHHPTAIATTLRGLRARVGEGARIIAVLEFGSYTMRVGVHKTRIKEALAPADAVICKETEKDWGLNSLLSEFNQSAHSFKTVDDIVDHLTTHIKPGDHVVIMSNSGFGGIHQKLIAALEKG